MFKLSNEKSANKKSIISAYLKIDKGKVKLGYYTSEGEEVVNAILSEGGIFGEKPYWESKKEVSLHKH